MVKQGTDSPGGKSGKGKKSRKEIKEEEELQAKKQELNQLGRTIRGLHVEFQQYIEEALEVLTNHRHSNYPRQSISEVPSIVFSHDIKALTAEVDTTTAKKVFVALCDSLVYDLAIMADKARFSLATTGEDLHNTSDLLRMKAEWGGDKSSIESFVNGDTIRYHNEVVDHHTTLQAAAKKAFVLTLDALRSFERRQRKFIQSIGYHNGIAAVSGGDGNDRNDQAAIIIPMIEEVLNDNSKLMLLEAPYEEKWQEICKAMSSVLIHEAADFVATAIAALEVDTRGKLEYLEFPQLRVRAE
ncbi:hypothetical protein Slin15195_G083540 [Septoria linicola]|uniref:Uncharacterized protein n=1 Tax=Septoria linicola TaxID=215465 RepID=A0A9Q9ELF2_9PEZI|nr:hypothetical protein Slin15195_G083540 [Septoria linicola]